MRKLMNVFLVFLSTGTLSVLTAEEVKAKPAPIIEIISQFSNDEYIFEAVRQPLGKKVLGTTSYVFQPPFKNIVIYRIWIVTLKRKSLFKEIKYNDLLKARGFDLLLNTLIKPRPEPRIENESDEILEYTTWLDLLGFNPSAGIACFNGYDPEDGKTTTTPIYYYNLGTDSFRFADSTITQEGKASISPSGKYLAMHQVISEHCDSIQIFRLGEHPKSLGLILNDDNEKAVQNGQMVKDELLGWEGDYHIKIKHSVFDGKNEQIPPPNDKLNKETILVVAVEPSQPLSKYPR